MPSFHDEIEDYASSVPPTIYYPRGNATWVDYLKEHSYEKVLWKEMDLPTISNQPVDQKAVIGSNASFVLKASGTGIKYQWQVSIDGGQSWKDVSTDNQSAVTNTLTVKAAKIMSGYLYRCIITDQEGQTVSAEAELIVLKNPSIATQPVSQTVKAGETAEFTVAAFDYESCKWQVSIDGGKTWKNVSATNKSSVTTTLKVKTAKKMNGYRYRCVLNNGGLKTISKSVKLKVVSKPVISTQPVSKPVKNGKNAVFSIKASGYDTCRWQVSADGGKTWKNVSAGNKTSTTKSLSVKTAKKMNGYRYRCVLKNMAGKTISKSVKLKVVSKPVISTQPVSKTVKKGKNVVFRIKASGYDSCRWQVSADGGKTWKNVSAGNKTATTKSLSVKTSKKMNGYRYRCVLKNMAGKTVSKSVKLKVK